MIIDVPKAIQLLLDGQVVALPTETVYGLAASLLHPEAIQEIFTLKGRSLKNPLIIHVADRDSVLQYTKELPPFFEELASKFWPGPLTMILPVKEKVVPSIVRAGLQTAGFRVPDHLETLQVIASTGPLVMPSANISGRPSATRLEHVEEDFGVDFPILDGGYSQKGVESTILIYQDSRWKIVRMGALTPFDFELILGYTPEIILEVNDENPLCPGQLFRHYAPKAQLLFDKQSDASFIIGFKERNYPAGKRTIYVGSIYNAAQVAENLYHVLRQLDLEGAEQAWVDMDFPLTGLWRTIHERLTRASKK